MDYDLDSHGVSVIDAKNNGNPDTFAALARALDVPWLAVFDGDNAGKGYVKAISKRGFTPREIKRRCRTHQAGDLEAQLVANGLDPELREILTELGRNAAGLTNDEVLAQVKQNKTDCATLLAVRFRTNANLVNRAPPAFRTTIEQLPGLT